ncbi:hypothetical protein [Nocardia vinacea]|uniref:hypothetical protein n=1 Tax=Nocardia vinacea TaxID=96468 RepID=UPI0002D6E75C|nr:hypothetical protein [Nocardia vinacea]
MLALSGVDPALPPPPGRKVPSHGQRIRRREGWGTTELITAEAAGTWNPGDFINDRLGFGEMRLTGMFDSALSDRDSAV